MFPPKLQVAILLNLSRELKLITVTALQVLLLGDSCCQRLFISSALLKSNANNKGHEHLSWIASPPEARLIGAES